MKKTIMFTFSAIFVCLALSANAALSPAIGILSKRLEMKRCMVQNDILTFDTASFDSYFGKDIQSITVCSLPSPVCGTLNCGSFQVSEGQQLTRDCFSLIRFVPSSNFSGTADFSFSAHESVLTCSVLVSETPNMSPVTGNQSVDTQKNVTVFKTFSAADPENDPLFYEIVKYPKNGSIYINDTDGLFVYSPRENYMGSDSFIYKATDAFGNSSHEQKVQIKVSKPACDSYFSDMKNHWAHNSAIKMASTGLMTGEEKDGKLVFSPDSHMTRGDFLALSLIIAGHEKAIPYTEKTVFADDSHIPSNIKSYAQYAYDKGFINGFTNDDGSVSFDSLGSITRAQAAVITNKILGLSDNYTSENSPLYSDASAIPSWASSDIVSLTACGILKGEPSGQVSAEKTLSRAEGAEMICNVAQYLEDKEKEEKPKKRTLSNLFGLLG